MITEGYFAAMGIPLLAGRMFDARDRDGAPLVTIVNRELASRFFSGENPMESAFTSNGAGPRRPTRS